MQSQIYTSLDFRLNLKWIEDMKKSKSEIKAIKHRVQQDGNQKTYTTIIQYA